MAEINGVKMTDEQFMLSMELGRILQQEGYDGDAGEIDPSKVKSERGRQILKKLEELSTDGK
jgi:hypothetical protein